MRRGQVAGYDYDIIHVIQYVAYACILTLALVALVLLLFLCSPVYILLTLSLLYSPRITYSECTRNPQTHHDYGIP